MSSFFCAYSIKLFLSCLSSVLSRCLWVAVIRVLSKIKYKQYFTALNLIKLPIRLKVVMPYNLINNRHALLHAWLRSLPKSHQTTSLQIEVQLKKPLRLWMETKFTVNTRSYFGLFLSLGPVWVKTELVVTIINGL